VTALVCFGIGVLTGWMISWYRQRKLEMTLGIARKEIVSALSAHLNQLETEEDALYLERIEAEMEEGGYI
jgi:predicted Zn-dependent protease